MYCPKGGGGNTFNRKAIDDFYPLKNKKQQNMSKSLHEDLLANRILAVFNSSMNASYMIHLV